MDGQMNRQKDEWMDELWLTQGINEYNYIHLKTQSDQNMIILKHSLCCN